MTSQKFGNAKLVDSSLPTRYAGVIRDAWDEYCTQHHKESRRGEVAEILREADSKILSYAMSRGNKPTLILTEDTHIKNIIPYINKKEGTNIRVYGLIDYTHALRGN
ncbi:hypothetical protein J4461_02435 [Candidatus Pacearchaeota archaeon]|nr:hypothetical protein [Candidatus Pacearchaeota archaeon]